jgi:hypothetical protein
LNWENDTKLCYQIFDLPSTATYSLAIPNKKRPKEKSKPMHSIHCIYQGEWTTLNSLGGLLLGELGAQMFAEFCDGPISHNGMHRKQIQVAT